VQLTLGGAGEPSRNRFRPARRGMLANFAAVFAYGLEDLSGDSPVVIYFFY
jgi:hypothetical protein